MILFASIQPSDHNNNLLHINNTLEFKKKTPISNLLILLAF